MPDREKVIKCLEACTGEENDCAGHTCPYWDYDGEVGCRTQMELDALALLKEQGTQKFLVDEKGKITPLPIVIPNCPLKEQEDKPVLDEFGKCFLNALKRQLDMKLTMIELLITPEFAEKVVELIEKMFD